MKACGIITEYNPFHNGHAYQLRKAKELSNADVMVVCMSGNFLQRGEPAIVDKWVRTEMALLGGADIVIELPVSFSAEPADYFARGGIALLQAMNCQALSFGAESGQGTVFHSAACEYNEKKEKIDTAFKEQIGDRKTYPHQIQQAIERVIPNFPLDLSKPNNTLGFAYAKENAGYNHPMEIFTVPRKSAAHGETRLKEGAFASATAIRKQLLEMENPVEALKNVSSFVPKTTLDLLKNRRFYSWENLWPLLAYQLTVQTPTTLRQIYQMTEGIEYRLKDKVLSSRSMEDFMKQVKNKRITWAKLQRLCTYILLQMDQQEMKINLRGPEAIRLLGFSPDGQRYLNGQKDTFGLPLLSNIKGDNKKMWETDIKAGEVYRLMDVEGLSPQDFYKNPVRILK